jgi:hypothetical protein
VETHSAKSRLSAAAHSGGVKPLKLRRPDVTSSQPYPTMPRNASFASMMRRLTLKMHIPMMLDSTRRLTFVSRS